MRIITTCTRNIFLAFITCFLTKAQALLLASIHIPKANFTIEDGFFILQESRIENPTIVSPVMALNTGKRLYGEAIHFKPKIPQTGCWPCRCNTYKQPPMTARYPPPQPGRQLFFSGLSIIKK